MCVLECSWKQPFLIINHFKDLVNGTSFTYLLCKRETDKIIKSARIFPTCREFVDACFEVFRCMETRQICNSKSFGVESERGFLLPIFIDYQRMEELDSCLHWGIQLENDESQQTYCSLFYFNLCCLILITSPTTGDPEVGDSRPEHYAGDSFKDFRHLIRMFAV